MSSPSILITGATRGIGFAAAKQLMARGACVIIASRDAKRAESATKTLGADALWVALDLNEQTSIDAAVKQLAGQILVVAAANRHMM